MILAIDPSKRCTGFVIASPDGTILDFTTFEFEKAKGMKATAEKMQFQSIYTRILKQAIKSWGITTIASEFPPGSQSAVAAWYLGMVTQCITAVSLTHLNKEALMVTPANARKEILGDRNAPKELGVEYALKALDGQLLDEFLEEPKYKREAIADAIVILHYFLPNLSTTEDNDNID